MAVKTDRRGLLIAAAAVGAVWGGGALWRAWDARRFDFEPVDGLPGFRRIAAGPVTRAGGTADPLVGLETRRPPPVLTDAEVCSALHRSEGQGVPVASFSDYFCPYCRVLTRELFALQAEGAVRVTWHELPLLSPASEPAARAALAAARQGGYEALHTRLMRSRFVASRAYLEDLAETAGLDAARLVAEMDGPEVSRDLDVARALADRFGFWATPALVVGRTAVLGAIKPARLRALIAIEAGAGPVCP